MLLRLALELTRPLRLDVALELDLAQASGTEPERAAAIAGTAADRARDGGDEAGEALARTAEAFRRSWLVRDPDVGELQTVAHSALELLEAQADHAGLVYVWTALGFGVANFRGRWDDWAQASEQVSRHALLAGQPSVRSGTLGLALASGSRPADEALEKVKALLEEGQNPSSSLIEAWLLAMLNRFEEAWPIAEQTREWIWELRGDHWVEWIPAEIAALEGDHEAAVRYLGPFCDLLEERDQRFYLSSVAPMLGRELCALGRYEEAERAADLTRRLDVRRERPRPGTPASGSGAALHASRGRTRSRAVRLAGSRTRGPVGLRPALLFGPRPADEALASSMTVAARTS